MRNFHHATLSALNEMVAAAGLDAPTQIRPEHVSRRISAQDVLSYAQLYPALEKNALLEGCDDPRFRRAWALANAASFAPAAG